MYSSIYLYGVPKIQPRSKLRTPFLHRNDVQRILSNRRSNRPRFWFLLTNPVRSIGFSRVHVQLPPYYLGYIRGMEMLRRLKRGRRRTIGWEIHNDFIYKQCLALHALDTTSKEQSCAEAFITIQITVNESQSWQTKIPTMDLTE